MTYIFVNVSFMRSQCRLEFTVNYIFFGNIHFKFTYITSSAGIKAVSSGKLIHFYSMYLFIRNVLIKIINFFKYNLYYFSHVLINFNIIEITLNIILKKHIFIEILQNSYTILIISHSVK